MIKDDGTINKLDMFQGFTSVKGSAAQNKICWLGLNQQAEEAIDNVMNADGSADDLASGTNTDVNDYDDEEDISPQPGIDIRQQLLALPPSDCSASRWISEKDIQDPETQEENLTWDKNLLTDSNEAADFEDTDSYYETLGCIKTSSDEDIKKSVKRARKKFRNIAIKWHPDKPKNKDDHAKYERDSSKHSKCVQANEELVTTE